MAYTFTLTTVLPASAREVYEAWLDSIAHSEMTGGEAVMSDEVGASITAWNGYITGRNLELVPGERIVQSWRTSEFDDEHEDSIVTVMFEDTDEGALVTLVHSNVPDDQRSYEEGGWESNYFEPMESYFAARQSGAANADRPKDKTPAPAAPRRAVSAQAAFEDDNDDDEFEDEAFDDEEGEAEDGVVIRETVISVVPAAKPVQPAKGKAKTAPKTASKTAGRTAAKARPGSKPKTVFKTAFKTAGKAAAKAKAGPKSKAASKTASKSASKTGSKAATKSKAKSAAGKSAAKPSQGKAKGKARAAVKSLPSVSRRARPKHRRRRVDGKPIVGLARPQKAGCTLTMQPAFACQIIGDGRVSASHFDGI